MRKSSLQVAFSMAFALATGFSLPSLALAQRGPEKVKPKKAEGKQASKPATPMVSQPQKGGVNMAGDATSSSSKSKKSETKYDRFFKDKKVQTAKGKFITLHKMDSKLYAELPLKYLGRDMLLGSTITSVSDPTYLSVGMRGSAPLHLRFEKQDSVIVIKTPNTQIFREGLSPEVQKTLQMNYQDPIIRSFQVETYTNDSTAVLLDFSSLMGRHNSLVSPVPRQAGAVTLTAMPEMDINFIKNLKSFDDNISVNVEMGYKISGNIMKLLDVMSEAPITLEATYSLQLLPEAKMTPRLADARLGVYTTEQYDLDEKKDKSRRIYLAHRWNLVPKDKKAYASGKLSEPIKPITFYVDPNFPEAWAKAIQTGIEVWNPAFEKIGFRNAIVVKPFPKNDKSFDSDNINFSCVRYVPTAETALSSNTWVHPETGEILSATITIPNNVVESFYTERFVQTSAVDARVRSSKLSPELFDESLSLAVAQEMGKVLGFMPNAAASSTYATEMLRSGETQSKGLAASILDGATYNYIAQPGDKSVRLVNNELGAYDYYAIDWNYRYYPQYEGKIDEETSAIEAMVDQKVKSPLYRFAPRQLYLYDPTALFGDLGNDPIKGASYGMKNLSLTLANLRSWVKNDEDSRIKTQLMAGIARQYHALHGNVAALVGGIKLNVAKESSGIARFEVVPRSKQREALLWTINNIKRFPSYANRQLERQSAFGIGYYEQLLEYLIHDLYNLRARVIVAEHLSGEGTQAYSLKDFFDDLYQQVFASTIAGKTPSQAEKLMEQMFVNQMFVAISGDVRRIVPNMPIASLTGEERQPLGQEELRLLSLAPNSEFESFMLQKTGFGNPKANIYPTLNIPSLDKSALYYYAYLSKLKPLLEQRVKTITHPELLAHYQTMLAKLNKALSNK